MHRERWLPAELEARYALLRRERIRAKLGTILPNEIILLELARLLARHYPPDGSARSLLDLGAGTRPYAPLYEASFSGCTSVDVDHSPHDTAGVDLIASADDLPFDDASFDCVLCTEVLEHCENPGAVLTEVARVLKPGGRVFLTTPFLVALHEMPYDYYRYTPSALATMAARAELQVESLVPRGEYVAVSLLTLQLPITKLWSGLSRLTGLPLYDARNPLVWLTILLPQRVYFALWRVLRSHRGGLLRRAYDRSSYWTLGYVTVLARPQS